MHQGSLTRNDDLTIIVPLKDRPEYTFRWMAYADKSKFPFKVFLADGGKDPKVREVLSDKSNFLNVKYEYVSYPYDKTYSNFYSKILDAITRVETPYVVLGDNDDFFFVDGLLQSVNFLKKNLEYASSRGQIGAFRLNSDQRIDYGYDIEVSPVTLNHSIEDESSASRIQAHFNPYTLTHFDVHRTAQLKSFYETLYKLDFENIFLAERLTSYLTVATGKVHRGAYMYLMRQANSTGSCAQGEHKQMDHFDRLLLESWSRDFTGFIKSVAQIVTSKDGRPIEGVKDDIKRWYRIDVAPEIVRSLTKNTAITSSSMIGKVRRFVERFDESSFFRKQVVQLYQKVFYHSPNTRYRLFSQLSHDDELYKAFYPIYQFLTNPPKQFVNEKTFC